MLAVLPVVAAPVFEASPTFEVPVLVLVALVFGALPFDWAKPGFLDGAVAGKVGREMRSSLLLVVPLRIASAAVLRGGCCPGLAMRSGLSSA